MRVLLWGGVAIGSAVVVALLVGRIQAQHFGGERSQRWAVCYAASLSWHEQANPGWSAQQRQREAAKLCDAQVPLRAR